MRKTEFNCPNCGSRVSSLVPGEVVCSLSDCPYHFKVFSKRDYHPARAFYLQTASKRLKYLRQANDNRWYVGHCPKTESFVAETILDLIDPKVLQTIQAGLSERLKRPMSIYVKFRHQPTRNTSQDFPVEIINKDGHMFGRVNPIDPIAYHCSRCLEIRGFKEGEEACTAYDIDRAATYFEEPIPGSKWGPCWAGLIDYSIPVIINGFVIAVFFTGQIQWIEPEGDKILSESNERISRIVPLSIQKLIDLTNDPTQLKEDSGAIQGHLYEYERLVKTISNVAEDRFWAERKARESEFLSELFAFFAAVESEKDLWKVLSNTLGRLNEFDFFRYSAFFINDIHDDTNHFELMSSGGTEIIDASSLHFSDKQMSKIFRKEQLLIVKENDTIYDTKLYATILEHLNTTARHGYISGCIHV